MNRRSGTDRSARKGRGRRRGDRFLALQDRIVHELSAALPLGLADRSRALLRRDTLAARAFRLALLS